jgi:hypothetical protein
MAQTRTPGITVLADGRLLIDKRYLGIRIGLRVGAVLAQELKPLGIHVTIVEPAGFRSDFAGPSLDSALGTIEDYRPSAGAHVRNYMATRHGSQANDPAKFGPAICRLVDAPEPPLRQPLGKDGYEFVRDTCLQVLTEIEQWKELAYSTAVDF